MKLNLKGKVVVITGSSRGIGRELIEAFSNEKAKVIINFYHSEEEAERLYNKIYCKNKECIKVKADVTKIQDVKFLMKETIKAFGRIDVLINNAGVCDDNEIQYMTQRQWDDVIRINLFGVFLCCKVFAEVMIKQNYGKIINIASLKGKEGNAEQANYSASKAGVFGLSKTLARELSLHNISVNVVCPGFIETDLNRMNFKKKRIAEERSLMQIGGNMRDLSNFVVFLASDKLLGVTGQIFFIDSRI